MVSLQDRAKSKTQNALFAMMATARIPTPLYSATDAILQYIKSVTVYHLYQRGNGFADDAN
jgi:hypothetical protein